MARQPGSGTTDEVSLVGAHLEDAILGNAKLEGAQANEETTWPAGFDWRAAGVIMAGEDDEDEEESTGAGMSGQGREDQP